MPNTSLVNILKSFSKEELIKFDDFLNSPYFNKAIYVKNYYGKIKELCPQFENPDNMKKEIFQSLYPGKKYNDATVRKLNSELLKLAEEFIISNSLRDKVYLKNNILLKELDKRKIDNLFIRKLESSYKALNNAASRNEEYFREMHDLNNTEIFFHSLRDDKREFSKYNESIENLDKFYLIQKLKRITILARVDSMYSRVIEDKKEINRFIAAVKKSKFFELPVMQLIFNILMINLTDEKEYFDNLKKLTPLYKNVISRDELESVYIAMLNFCVSKANKGTTEYATEELNIYKNMIEDDFLLVNERLQAVMYKNIVFCAVDAGDLQFAEEFKNQYEKHLFIAEKVNLIEFCNAYIAYAKKDYPSALEMLAKINFTLVNQRYSLRGLYFKIFYESGMYEQAILNIDSYKQTLKREKTLAPEVMKLYSSFASLYSKLLKIKLLPDKNEASILLNTIIKSDTVAKSWLIKQCSALC